MELALISAFGVGGATIAGVIIGFFFQKIPHKFNDAILGFAAGNYALSCNFRTDYPIP